MNTPNKIQEEFLEFYPSFIYITHEEINENLIGVSFVFINAGKFFGAVRVFKRENGHINWLNPIKTFTSWKELYQMKEKTR